MVVDDEVMILRAVQRVLGRCGYEVEACSRPEEALGRFLAEPYGFDAVITDYRMPRMNGVELSERLLGERPDLAILVVSGYPGEVDTDLAKALGIRGVLAKPVDTSQLTAFLARIVPPQGGAGVSSAGG
ncbi:MAG: response regulator [Deltaproteobacteria bacterium]|nr:response regulator [Deltaproteobacteria bacterium]